MGISYGGISQLFTAALQPPSLAAISPLSVLDATATTLYPGGILNNGFAVAWAKERQHEALPAGPDAGQPWAYDRIQNGDTTCAANQVLHAEAADLHAKIAANSHYDAAVADPLDPVTFVQQDQGADVHGLPVGGRADRRPLPRARPQLHRHDARSGSRSPTARTSTRSIPTRTTAGTTSCSCSSRTRRRSQNSAITRAAAPVDLPAGDGAAADRPRHAARPTRSSCCRPTTSRSPRSRRCRRCGCCSTTARARARSGPRAPVTPTPRSRQDFSALPVARHDGPHLVPRVGRRAHRHARRRARASTRSHAERARAAPHRLRRQHRHAAGCGATRRSGRGTGSRTRPAPRSRTSRRR